jgi:hypothetical protein
MDNMEEVVALGNEAMNRGHSPEDPLEWLTFIEANAFTGNVEAARRLSMQMRDQDARTNKSLCVLWKRIQAESRAGSASNIAEISSDLGCSP